MPRGEGGDGEDGREEGAAGVVMEGETKAERGRDGGAMVGNFWKHPIPGAAGALPKKIPG